jgi:NTP pyrophosphatase (non-canonical NTP hydrolase)
MTIEETVDKVIQWGIDRGIYKGSDAIAQHNKLMEEVDEILVALLNHDQEETKDAIGDCMVVLTHIAILTGFNLGACYEHAYNQIKDRKGKMVNGIFVKDN